MSTEKTYENFIFNIQNGNFIFEYKLLLSFYYRIIENHKKELNDKEYMMLRAAYMNHVFLSDDSYDKRIFDKSIRKDIRDLIILKGAYLKNTLKGNKIYQHLFFNRFVTEKDRKDIFLEF